ncbi:hypothetical protein C8R47DRAFT_255767 [Mycena vitilis]|nr:hypothetical protein C8R47DRAFT_255767 [Mycena vitilis]
MMKTRSWPAFSLAALLARPCVHLLFVILVECLLPANPCSCCRTRCVRLIIDHAQDTPFITGGPCTLPAATVFVSSRRANCRPASLVVQRDSLQQCDVPYSSLTWYVASVYCRPANGTDTSL